MSFLRWKLLFIFLWGNIPLLFSQVYSPTSTTALVGAMDEEIELLQQSLQHSKTKIIHGIPFYTGKIGKHKVVILKTGIGKVNASMAVAFLLKEFRPKQVIFTGIAGGLRPDLEAGDIVIGKQTLQYDYGQATNDSTFTRATRNPLTKQLNPLYFLADSILLATAQEAATYTHFRPLGINHRSPKILTGTIVTGDLLVTSEIKANELRRKFGADATEMEGAAVAQICWQQKVPCLVIRSMSDKADSKARDSIENFKQVASYNSAHLLLNLLEKLP
jgi:adenosylhomocysteine nucleosidase